MMTRIFENKLSEIWHASSSSKTACESVPGSARAAYPPKYVHQDGVRRVHRPGDAEHAGVRVRPGCQAHCVPPSGAAADTAQGQARTSLHAHNNAVCDVDRFLMLPLSCSWREHDPEVIMAGVHECLSQAVKKVLHSQILVQQYN